MKKQKYGLYRLMHLQKTVVYARSQEEKHHKDVQNFFKILNYCVELQDDQNIENAIKLFNKKFKVDSYDEGCVVYSKLSNKQSKNLQETADQIKLNNLKHSNNTIKSDDLNKTESEELVK